MGKMIRMLLFVLVLFGAAAGASWFVMNQRPAVPVDAAAAAAAPAAAIELSGGAADTAVEGLPIAVRPEPMTPEEVLRHALSLRNLEQALRERSEAIDRREAQLQLVRADIEGEQQVLQSLQEELQLQIEAAEQLLNDVQNEKQSLEAQRQEAAGELEQFRQEQVELDSAERENLKQLSKWLSSMEPEAAAGLIQELANNGQMDMVVQLLADLDERQASKILEAVGDLALIADLAERFRQLKRPEAPTRRR